MGCGLSSPPSVIKGFISGGTLQLNPNLEYEQKFTNGSEEVYCNTLWLGVSNQKITSIELNGTPLVNNGMATNAAGDLFLWLPATDNTDTITVTIGGRIFTGSLPPGVVSHTLTENAYTVTFKPGTNGAMDDEDVYKENVSYGGSVVSVPSITSNIGYTFIGWKCSENGGLYDETAVKSYAVTDNLTFTAQYTDSAKAAVIFDYNGGTVNGAASSSKSGKQGDSYNVPIPTRTGYTFDG